LQPGSSIMQGKVNPVMPELMNIVAFRVMGNDYSVCLAAHSAQLQLNAYEPLEGLAVLESKALLYSTSSPFPSRHIDGITVDEKTLNHCMETMVGIVTALNPVLGYEKATELTCDPVAGYVQVPCIERCAYGAVKAWIGYSIASEDASEEIPDQRRVDLDTSIAAMALTAKEMNTRYKETSEDGLAVSVVLC
jgi:Serine dehydratase alpha chain/Lyase